MGLNEQGLKAVQAWANLPKERRMMLVELLKMEAEGGGWIPNDMFKDQPKEAERQTADLQVLINLIEAMEPA